MDRALLDPALAYFPPATDDCPTFVGDSTWEPLVDGAAYLPALSSRLAEAGAGDAVIIVGLELDPALDLHGRQPGEPGYDPLGMRLARMAAAGVDVRIVLASRVLGSSVPGTVFGGFRGTAKQATTLRGLRPDPDAAPPLARRVLLDFSGALLGSNHQKAVVTLIAGELVAYIGGIDLVTDRFDAGPHDRLRLDGERWGWHDMSVRVRGRAAEQAWTALRQRWVEAATLPLRHWIAPGGRPARLNPPHPVDGPLPAYATVPATDAHVAVRVLRSMNRRKIDTLPGFRRSWTEVPDGGYQEVFGTLRAAVEQARRYVYLEDQYLEESPGGDDDYELFPLLRAAAARGVKVVLLGSGTRDPEDVGVHLEPINRSLNPDILEKIVEPLDADARDNVAVYRLEHATVHAKLVLVDDVFAAIGSANMFSRSMAGTDCELTAAVVTAGTEVRDLRVAVWAEHLRAPRDTIGPALENLDVALGIWRPHWAASGDPLLWREPDRPVGFAPAERALHLVGP